MEYFKFLTRKSIFNSFQMSRNICAQNLLIFVTGNEESIWHLSHVNEKEENMGKCFRQREHFE